ncbi:AcrR family transcriptional regulator [Allocatelliglobosispora scoriae]|uniref:AcrR family transcriptional regulator n=1 Tax=Allocatelliglobosispora scoriae TaxID=643052 RepID=A0A841BLS3_9ACTN|nr:TetR/AcrR family transcriptional regulator [Allocatelliglobosispora scoriae]MBB5868308.1 AcrR family transcriptional regulator [Allocatelliglobosispora scoriae]
MSTSPKRKGRTRNRRGEGGLLRDEIVSAAERLLESEGSEEAITLRSVAREAGIAAPSIYTHFADREAIIDAVLDIGFERLRLLIVENSAAEGDPVKKLIAGCRAYVDFAMTDPARYRVLFGRSRAGGGPPEGEQHVELESLPPVWQRRLEAFHTLVHALEACVAAERSTSTDPFSDATALWTSMHGAVLMRQFVPRFPWPPLAEAVEELARRIGRIRD